MNPAVSADSRLSLAPLGAGDLIDRAVRFYRKHFWTFILIAAPPVIAGTAIFLVWTLVGRQLFSISSDKYSPEAALYYIFMGLGNVAIWLTEWVATLVVMGGASRNFVRHLLFGEAITFRETYLNSWRRLGSLIVASTLICIVLGVLGLVIFYFGLLVGSLLVILIVALLSPLPALAFIVSVPVGLAVAFGTLWLFFLIASRVVYVQQVMLVEGQGIFAAIGRSATLASGNVRRLIALFLFTTGATYSALAILYVPLLWYASANGVEIMTFSNDLIPAWYEIASNIIGQISFIMLSPVWMIGLCLLYVDERVRSEGYDIELMAAARLGEIPDVPAAYVNPLQPALSARPHADSSPVPPPVPRSSSSQFTTLGLK